MCKVPPTSKNAVKAAHEGGNPFKPDTGQWKVYEYIRDNPGEKGKDIINALGISPKTVRNAFHRLKLKELASNDDGWRLTDR